jgi:hypothetical protein
MRLKYVYCLTALWCFANTAAGRAADLDFRLVAGTGDVPPGMDGVRFGHFGPSFIDNQGRVSFFGTVDGWATWITDGIWGPTQNVPLGLIHDSSVPLPGLDNMVLRSPEYAMGPGGHVTFSGSVTPADTAGSSLATIWVTDNLGQPQLVASEGQLVPDGSGARLQHFHDHGITSSGDLGQLNDRGHIAFIAELMHDAAVQRGNDGALLGWFGSDDLHLIARSGDPVPGADGLFYAWLDYTQPVMNNLDRGAFAAPLVTAPVDGPPVHTHLNNWGLWRFAAAEPTRLIANTGMVAPGTGGQSFDQIFVSSINDGGEIAMPAVVGAWPTLSTGIWRVTADDELENVMLSGEAAPGVPGGVFSHQVPGLVVLNDVGTIFFHAQLEEGPGGVDLTNLRGFWQVERDGTSSLIVREGDPAPGLENAFFHSLDFGPFVNNHGDLVFRASVRGEGPEPLEETGVWVYDSQIEQLVPLAITGQDFEVLPGDVRRIAEIGFVNDWAGTSDGQATLINDRRQISLTITAWRGSFQEGPFTIPIDPFSGVYVIQIVPEPVAASLLAMVMPCGLFILIRNKSCGATPRPGKRPPEPSYARDRRPIN